jgi:hypothetical protein
MEGPRAAAVARFTCPFPLGPLGQQRGWSDFRAAFVRHQGIDGGGWNTCWHLKTKHGCVLLASRVLASRAHWPSAYPITVTVNGGTPEMFDDGGWVLCHSTTRVLLTVCRSGYDGFLACLIRLTPVSVTRTFVRPDCCHHVRRHTFHGIDRRDPRFIVGPLLLKVTPGRKNTVTCMRAAVKDSHECFCQCFYECHSSGCICQCSHVAP